MSALKSWQTAIAAGLALSYWVVVLAIPETADPWASGLRWAIGIVGAALLAASLALLVASIWWSAVESHRGVLVLLGLVGVVLSIIALVTNQALNFTDERRFAVGVGGLAIAGLAFGMTRFDSVRAAVSVPAAVLVIGAAGWPAASNVIPDEFRAEIVKWMGILLGVNGAAEAAKQYGEASAKGKVQSAAIAAGSDVSEDVVSGMHAAGDLA